MSKRLLYVVQVLVGVALILLGFNAHAVRMGALSVDSALGEPLSASIRLYDAEGVAVDSVTVSMASPSVYDSLGLIYNDLISRINLRYENVANGPLVKLSTQDPVNEVVLDLRVEVIGPEGKVSKTYVAFIDPPFLVDERLSLSALEAELLSIEESAEKILSEQAVEPSDLVVSPEAIEIEPAINDLVESPESIASTSEIVDEVNISVTEVAPSFGRQVIVRPGDTLTKIAQREKFSDFSLEQMLVGIFRKNREAFVGDNMNRLRAGNVIRIPVENELQAIPVKEAASEIRIHMADWRAYKDNLAARPSSQIQSTKERVSPSESGVVEAASDQVNVQTQSGNAYVVEVSKGSVDKDSGSQGLEERLLATEKELEEQKTRADELEKIIAELTLLAQSTQNQGSAIQSGDERGTTGPPQSTQGDAWQAKIIKAVLHQPLYLLMPILVLLIMGLWVSKRLNRLNDDGNDDVMQPVVEKDERPDPDNPTTFNQSGETNVARNQDPVEDADIFLAYGRYPQAEKILKEALLLEPKRLDILLKLAEVYSRQKDLANFDVVAEHVADITNETGAYWERLLALGYLINPANERYAEGKFVSEGQASAKPVDLSSIDLDLGKPPAPKS